VWRSCRNAIYSIFICVGGALPAVETRARGFRLGVNAAEGACGSDLRVEDSRSTSAHSDTPDQWPPPTATPAGSIVLNYTLISEQSSRIAQIGHKIGHILRKTGLRTNERRPTGSFAPQTSKVGLLSLSGLKPFFPRNTM